MTDTQATPRPWAMLQGFPDYIVVLVDRDKPLNWSKLPDYATPLCETHGPNNTANAALIVTAVNEYAALKAVEAAARGAINYERLRGRNCECKASSGCDAAVAEQNVIAALAALDAIRKPDNGKTGEAKL